MVIMPIDNYAKMVADTCKDRTPDLTRKIFMECNSMRGGMALFTAVTAGLVGTLFGGIGAVIGAGIVGAAGGGALGNMFAGFHRDNLINESKDKGDYLEPVKIPNSELAPESKKALRLNPHKAANTLKKATYELDEIAEIVKLLMEGSEEKTADLKGTVLVQLRPDDAARMLVYMDYDAHKKTDLGKKVYEQMDVPTQRIIQKGLEWIDQYYPEDRRVNITGIDNDRMEKFKDRCPHPDHIVEVDMIRVDDAPVVSEHRDREAQRRLGDDPENRHRLN